MRQDVLDLYSAKPGKESFANNCLLARRLVERGVLDDTIVVFTGEFGRTSDREGPLAFDYGRDHQALCNSVLVAGGGFKRGFAYGKTDDWGCDVVDEPVHMHDLHARLLRCLGLDHENLTFRHQSRDFRLTDVGGRVVNELLI